MRPIADQFYGHREGTLQDPFGYTWSVSTVTEEMSVEEMHRRMKGLRLDPKVGDCRRARRAGVNPVPRGFRMVTPYLVAQDGLRCSISYKQGLRRRGDIAHGRTPTGGVHGEVRIGDSMLMIGGGIPGQEFPATLHPHALHVYVEDADAVYKKAVAAGATLIDEPRDQEYGERSASVKDPAGNFWYIATHKGESYIPKGLHNVNPYLHPLRAEPVIGFLKRAFGGAGIGEICVAGRSGAPRGDSHWRLGRGDGRGSRQV